MIREKIARVENANRTQYLCFLERVFVDEEELSWTEVIELLVPRREAPQPQNVVVSTLRIA
jgi:hypothetical protein